jgi:hypothetical protein
MWDLWWTKLHWGQVFSEYFGFQSKHFTSCSTIILIWYIRSNVVDMARKLKRGVFYADKYLAPYSQASADFYVKCPLFSHYQKCCADEIKWNSPKSIFMKISRESLSLYCNVMEWIYAWFDVRIYWTYLVTTRHKSLSHTDQFFQSPPSLLCWVTASNSRRCWSSEHTASQAGGHLT